MSRPYLDYYSSQGIVPVHQDVSDFEAHVRRRAALYRLLKMTRQTFRGSTVLEIGPGTGDNAMATATFGPAKYLMLEGNPSSLESISTKLSAGELDGSVFELIEADYLSIPQTHALRQESFDIVLAEGCVPYQLDPVAALRTAADLVSTPYGIFVVTATDEVSMLSEICRRYMKPAMVRVAQDGLRPVLDVACETLASHLDHLSASSRPIKDWVEDNILHPWVRDWALSVPAAIAALPNFDYLGSTPSHITDWRWYKTFADESVENSSSAANAWTNAVEYTLDWRSDPHRAKYHQSDIGLEIMSLSRDVWLLVDEDWHRDTYDNSDPVADALESIARLLDSNLEHVPTSNAIREFVLSIPSLEDGRLDFPFRHFQKWWGRGMQYMSLTRKG